VKQSGDWGSVEGASNWAERAQKRNDKMKHATDDQNRHALPSFSVRLKKKKGVAEVLSRVAYAYSPEMTKRGRGGAAGNDAAQRLKGVL